jgi:hypothetical protein
MSNMAPNSLTSVDICNIIREGHASKVKSIKYRGLEIEFSQTDGWGNFQSEVAMTSVGEPSSEAKTSQVIQPEHTEDHEEDKTSKMILDPASYEDQIAEEFLNG